MIQFDETAKICSIWVVASAYIAVELKSHLIGIYFSVWIQYDSCWFYATETKNKKENKVSRPWHKAPRPWHGIFGVWRSSRAPVPPVACSFGVWHSSHTFPVRHLLFCAYPSFTSLLPWFVCFRPIMTFCFCTPLGLITLLILLINLFLYCFVSFI